ncbi:MAG TPA: GNAT family N-acetyltransferase [Solirubrobacteraceae bacterium]|nr:GNAT family N-acetyltransferase [Solirubrobacteraceae bacterium]
MIRPIDGTDHERLRDSHERLSPETRYRRFLAVKPHLTKSDVRYLVDIDGVDHVALVATLPEAEGAPIVGVARFIRIPQEPEVAEVAIVVNDALQGRGVGTELLARLAGEAVARGVRRFRATMLADNLAIHRLFESLAAGPVDRRRLGEISEMEFPLPLDGPAADGPAALAA